MISTKVVGSRIARSFYLSVAGLALVGVLNSCGGKTDEQPHQDSTITHRERPKMDVTMTPAALPNGELFKVEYTKHGVDSILNMPEASKLATPLSAAQYNLSMPPKMTVPPHVMPAKDIKVMEQTDSTAMVSFAAEHNPMFGRMLLKKVTDGAKTVWLVETVTALHPGP
jgi:hypothetical protein